MLLDDIQDIPHWDIQSLWVWSSYPSCAPNMSSFTPFSYLFSEWICKLHQWEKWDFDTGYPKGVETISSYACPIPPGIHSNILKIADKKISLRVCNAELMIRLIEPRGIFIRSDSSWSDNPSFIFIKSRVISLRHAETGMWLKSVYNSTWLSPIVKYFDSTCISTQVFYQIFCVLNIHWKIIEYKLRRINGTINYPTINEMLFVYPITRRNVHFWFPQPSKSLFCSLIPNMFDDCIGKNDYGIYLLLLIWISNEYPCPRLHSIGLPYFVLILYFIANFGRMWLI